MSADYKLLWNINMGQHVPSSIFFTLVYVCCTCCWFPGCMVLGNLMMSAKLLRSSVVAYFQMWDIMSFSIHHMFQPYFWLWVFGNFGLLIDSAMTMTLYISRCARIVQAMLPLVSAELEKAAASVNTVTAKSSLFSLCTSLMVGFLYAKYWILEIIFLSSWYAW